VAARFDERIAGERCFDLIACQKIKPQPELIRQLLLPLFDETPWRDHEAPRQIASDHEFLDQEPCHDRLSRAGIVGEQEPQRLTRQHLAVHGRDLVRQQRAGTEATGVLLQFCFSNPGRFRVCSRRGSYFS
jgi:hypothetical protein